jgi:hypothetical protein
VCGYAGSAGVRVHLAFCAFIANWRAADDIKTQVRERQRETELGLGTEGRKESVACLLGQGSGCSTTGLRFMRCSDTGRGESSWDCLWRSLP